MLSSMLTCRGMIDGLSYGDVSSVRRTPVSEGHYRCPVSTPANYLGCSDELLRSKTLPNISLQQTATIGRRSLTSQRPARIKSKTGSDKFGSSFEVCFLDMAPESFTKESQQSHWLNSLCAQPVDEILNKYRGNGDFSRARKLWSQTASTPGEKSLLYAWRGKGATGRRHSPDGGDAARVGDRSSLTALPNHNSRRIGLDHAVREIICNAHGCDGDVLATYLQESPRLQDDFRVVRKLPRTIQSCCPRGLTDGHDQLSLTKMGMRRRVTQGRNRNV